MEQGSMVSRLGTVKPRKKDLKDARSLAKLWSEAILKVKTLRDTLKSCHFSKASEALKFQTELKDAELADFKYARFAASILKLGHREHLDEVVSLKALQHSPWIEAKIKLTRAQYSEDLKKQQERAAQGFAQVSGEDEDESLSKRRERVRSKEKKRRKERRGISDAYDED